MRASIRTIALATVIATSSVAPPTQAAEIRLLSAAAMQTVFYMITDEFERTSGHKLVFAYTTMGAITERVMAGETADLIIGSTQSIERLAKEGRIDPASRVTIAKVGIGAVVPTGISRSAAHTARWNSLPSSCTGMSSIASSAPAK